MNARQPGRLPVLLFTLAALLLSPQLDASRALTSAAANASAPSYLETRIGASEIEGRELVGALGSLSAEERSGYAVSTGGSAAGEHLAVLVHNGGLSAVRRIAVRSKRPLVRKVRGLLRGHVSEAIAELARNPARAKQLMTRGSYLHLVHEDGLSAASFGKAVERLAGDFAMGDMKLRGLMDYTGRRLIRDSLGRFTSAADFTPLRRGLPKFDITTARDVAKHERRYGRRWVEYLTYERPAGLVFPK